MCRPQLCDVHVQGFREARYDVGDIRGEMVSGLRKACRREV